MGKKQKRYKEVRGDRTEKQLFIGYRKVDTGRETESFIT